MNSASNPRQNRLLAALSAKTFQRLLPALEPVRLEAGQLLDEPGQAQVRAYFPTDALVSIIYGMKDGRSAEIALVGNEGVVGVPLFMADGSTPSRAQVQMTGHAFALAPERLQAEFARAGDFQKALLHYTQALLTQVAQTAVCNRHHAVEQQLCRWLLMSLDRLPTNTLSVTQELIASMLGVRREGITEAAGRLQAAGLIQYGRGRISIINRPGLEARVCECYAVVRREFERLLPPVQSDRAAPRAAG